MLTTRTIHLSIPTASRVGLLTGSISVVLSMAVIVIGMTQEIYLSGPISLERAKEEIAGRFRDIGLAEGSNLAQHVSFDEQYRIHCGGQSAEHRIAIFDWILHHPGAYNVSTSGPPYPDADGWEAGGVFFRWAAPGEPNPSEQRSPYAEPDWVSYGDRAYPVGAHVLATSEGICVKCNQAIAIGDLIRLLEGDEQLLVGILDRPMDGERATWAMHEPCE